MPPTIALIDSGPIVAYYNAGDDWHIAARKFWETFKGQLITTEAVCTEVMYLLDSSKEVQNEFLSDLAKEIFQLEPLMPPDFKLIAELNLKYKDLPGDFADLSLVAIAERCGYRNVVSLDADFDAYRKYGKEAFNQLFPKYEKSKRKR